MATVTLDSLILQATALRADFNQKWIPAIKAIEAATNQGETVAQISDRYKDASFATIDLQTALKNLKGAAADILEQPGVSDFVAGLDRTLASTDVALNNLKISLARAQSNQATATSTSQAASGGTAATPQTQGAASSANPDNADTAAGGSAVSNGVTVTPLGAAGATTVTAIPGSAGRIAAGASGSIALPTNFGTTAGFPQTALSREDAAPTLSQTIRASSSSASAANSNTLGVGSGPLTNPLDKYASYTYNLSLYLLTPEDYNKFVDSDTTSETINLPGDQLLIRSGGSPVGAGKRNSYFSDCDFTLDNLRIESVIGFSEQGVPSSLGRLSFTITEPAGATFIYRLQSATAELANKDPNSARQYYAHTYAIVIRFYGYDSNGQPITPKGDINQLDLAGSSESAVLTKIFLFMLSDVKTRIGTRIVEYQCSGIFGPSFVARTAMLGVSPARFELTGTNLNDIFNGIPGTSNNANNQDANPRAETGDADTQEGGFYGDASKVSAQPSQNIPTRGLCQAINQELQKLSRPQKQGTKAIDIPDEYEVLFASDNLRNAKIITAGLDNSLVSAAGDVPTDTKSINTRENTSVPKNAKNVRILPGTPIIQWLDMMIRNSEYVKSQASLAIKERSTDADAQGEEDFYGKKVEQTKPVKWYKITPFNKILGYDKLRKTYANKVIFAISEYGVTDVRSPYFKRAPWRGPDKLYNFTFTGQNTSVLNYEQDFNALYRQTFGIGAQLGQDAAKEAAAAAGQVGASYAFRVVAETGKQGSLGDSTDPAARAAAGIYSFTDLAKAKLKIIGDPDLLLQDWYNVNQALINRQNLTQAAGGNDSNILNSNLGELYFQVTFLTGDDWNLADGIVKVEPRQGFVRRQSNAYKFTKINSEFQNGRFTQDIEGIILADVNPDQAFVKGDYTSGVAGQLATDTPVDTVTDTDSVTARQETTEASTGAFDTDGSNDLRTQEGGPTTVPQSPTSALPATAPPTFAQRQAAAAEAIRQARRDQFRRKLLPNQAQTGNDDAPGISDIIAP